MARGSRGQRVARPLDRFDPLPGSGAEDARGSRSPSEPLSVLEWLASPCLARVASRVAYQYGLPSQDTPDLLQDLRLALWKAGPNLVVNLAWVFHTANHKAVDLLKRRIRLAREISDWPENPSPPGGVDPALVHLLHARAARLPKRLYDFYLLRYEEGLSQREIAKRLNLCRSSVRCLDRRCLRMVKGRLAVRGKSHPLLQSPGDPAQVTPLQSSVGVHAPADRNVENVPDQNHRVGADLGL